MQIASCGILLSLALATAPLVANAEVYKCVTDGQTTYSSTPCDKNAAPQAQTPLIPAPPTTQTVVSSQQVSIYEPAKPESSKSGVFDLDSWDGLTIALVIIAPVVIITLMFMSRRTRGLTK